MSGVLEADALTLPSSGATYIHHYLGTVAYESRTKHQKLHEKASAAILVDCDSKRL